MTREETKKIIHIMSASYPNYKPANLSETVDVWTAMLEEYKYSDIAIALKTYITTNTSGFAPSIGQLIEKIQQIHEPDTMSEAEAWSMVSRAIRRSGYYAEEEFSKLPPLVQKAVGAPSQLRIWALDDEYNESVVSSNFMRSYRVILSRQKEFDRMPKDVKMLIENAVAKNRALLEGRCGGAEYGND